MNTQVIFTMMATMLLVLGCNTATNSKLSKSTNGYVLSGTIKGVEDGTIYLKQNDVLSRTAKVLDSTSVKDGAFVFKGYIASPDQVFLQKEDKTVSFFLENTKMEVMADVSQPHDAFSGIETTIKGSALNALYKKQQAIEKAIINQDEYTELNRIQKAYRAAQQARDSEKSKTLYAALEKLESVSEKRSKALLSSKLQFVKKHPSAAVSPQVLGFMFSERGLTVQDMDDIMATFSGNAKNTSMYKYFDDEYKAIKRTSPGAKAPDFTLKTPAGEDFSLSDIKDKYILIDFWASWCKPCRASYPHLKKVYSKYKDKGFEVLAVSTDSDHDAWKKAIKEDQTNWVHVVDTFNRPGFPSDISTLYAVPFLPTTYLVDNKGVILAKNLSPDELDEKMKALFGY